MMVLVHGNFFHPDSILYNLHAAVFASSSCICPAVESGNLVIVSLLLQQHLLFQGRTSHFWSNLNKEEGYT